LTTFVTIGNAHQPFHRLLGAVSAIVSTLPQPVVVQHGNTPWSGCDVCIAKPFVGMAEFDKLLNQAELLILHAGVSVLQAIRAGKTPVVMPRRAMYGEIVIDHQWEFARALAETGKIVLANEPSDLPAAVVEAMKRQDAQRITTTVPPLVGLIGELLRQYDRKTGK